MNKVKVIGITGKKFHGKDTAAEIFKLFLGVDKTLIMSFASPIKNAIKTLFLLNESQLSGSSKENYCWTFNNGEKVNMMTPRIIMQKFGDAMKSTFGNDIFLKNMKNRIIDCENNYKYIIISDVRFNNEAELIKNYGGIIVKIDASKRVNNDDKHISENGIDNKFIDYYLDNNYYRKNLELEINDIINKIK